MIIDSHYKDRCIAGSSKCSTKPPCLFLTKISSTLKEMWCKSKLDYKKNSKEFLVKCVACLMCCMKYQKI